MYYLLKTDTAETERIHITEIRRRISAGQLKPTAQFAPENAPNDFHLPWDLFPALYSGSKSESTKSTQAKIDEYEGTATCKTALKCAFAAPFLWFPGAMIPTFGIAAYCSIPVLATFAIVLGRKGYRQSRNPAGRWAMAMGIVELLLIVILLVLILASPFTLSFGDFW